MGETVNQFQRGALEEFRLRRWGITELQRAYFRLKLGDFRRGVRYPVRAGRGEVERCVRVKFIGGKELELFIRGWAV